MRASLLTNKFKKRMSLVKLFLLASFVPAIAWSQATSSLMIPLNNQTVKVTGKNAQIDLLKEIKTLKPALNSVSNIEIQMVRIQAKSNIGGGQIFLKINNDLVASAVVETNPDVFSSTDSRTFEKFELKNIDRARVTLAALQIQNSTNLRLSNLEVIFGSVQEPTIFGNYATSQVNQVGGALLNDNRDLKPSQKVVEDIYSKYYGIENVTTTPVVVAPPPVRPQPTKPVVVSPVKPTQPVVSRPPVKPPVKQPAKPPQRQNSDRCLQDYRGTRYCIGDTVENTWGFAQKIVGVNARNNEVTLTSEMYDEPYTRHVDMLKR